jgi:hypothetical protein
MFWYPWKVPETMDSLNTVFTEGPQLNDGSASNVLIT